MATRSVLAAWVTPAPTAPLAVIWSVAPMLRPSAWKARPVARVRACVPQRSPEETAVIARAKQRLMDEGWTEAQAHALLQKKSMISRRSMADVARELLEEA